MKFVNIKFCKNGMNHYTFIAIIILSLQISFFVSTLILLRSIKRSQMKTKFCLEETKFNIPEMKFDALISCTNYLKDWQHRIYIFNSLVPGLTGKKFSLKISGKQKRFHVSSGSGFLVCTPIYSPMRFVFVIKHVTYQNMLLLMDVLGAEVFLELPLFSVTFYPSRYKFF